MKVEIEEGMSNDSTYNCEQCGNRFIVFSTNGETGFCPSCGMRLDDFW